MPVDLAKAEFTAPRSRSGRAPQTNATEPSRAPTANRPRGARPSYFGRIALASKP
jgi:hypothetical protein